MTFMGILIFMLFGLVVGLLARAIMPGRQDLSLLMTSVLGMAGAVIGGYVVGLFAHEPGRFQPLGLLGSLLGALALLAVYSVVTRRHVAQ